MDVVGLALLVIGALGCIVSGLWLTVCAFQKSMVWGLCYVFIPFASVVYVFSDWNRAMKPFVLVLLSTLIAAGGIVISPTAKEAMRNTATTGQTLH